MLGGLSQLRAGGGCFSVLLHSAAVSVVVLVLPSNIDSQNYVRVDSVLECKMNFSVILVLR